MANPSEKPVTETVAGDELAVAPPQNDTSGEAPSPARLDEGTAQDAEVVATIVPAKPSVPVPVRAVRGARKWSTVTWLELQVNAKEWRWWLRVVLTLAQLGAVTWPIFKYGLKAGLFSTIVYMGSTGFKKWREHTPKDMQLVERNYVHRKLTMYRLISELERRPMMTPPEVERFRREALELVACYVRDHRRDGKSTSIYANILVEDGDDMVVIARDREHRVTGARTPKTGMLAWDALRLGDAVATGDLYADYPNTPPGKPYRSVLAIPIRHEGRIVGVLSIDSSKRHHFDLRCTEIVDYLMPYIALLAWTLPKMPISLTLPKVGGRDQ